MTDSSVNRGSAEAQQRFEEIFRRHSPAVFRYALKSLSGDADRANEIVQEVFTAVWIQLDRDFLKMSDYSTLPMIMKIATRRVADCVRRRRKNVILVPDYVDDQVSLLAPHGRINPLDLMLSELDLEHFRDMLLNELTDNEYQVALMSWELGFSDSEIGEVMGILTVTVRSHKSRARAKVHAIVERGDHRTDNSKENLGRNSSNLRKSSGGEVIA
ncbi:RNA polymerase sigma factor [Nocardia sp. bgisy134]|uniref:RNA polymerase sigma factor n=1 Tax=Nocardia sp. bgisy134 TaxID=3413789 RepID=UPI003D75D579